MSQYLDCNGVPLKVGDMVMCVKLKSPEWKHMNGTVFQVKGLCQLSGVDTCEHEVFSSLNGIESAEHTGCSRVMKLQDLDDDEILQNNVLFSTTTDTWERITDYPKQPTLEPELVPA